jgi:hypothetical protein
MCRSGELTIDVQTHLHDPWLLYRTRLASEMGIASLDQSKNISDVVTSWRPVRSTSCHRAATSVSDICVTWATSPRKSRCLRVSMKALGGNAVLV